MSKKITANSEDELEEEEEDDDSEIDAEDECESDENEDEPMSLVDEDDKTPKNKRQTRYLAAASLCIGVGSFEDPRDIQGLMHFLEHMVFMGSQKFPKENCFDNFIKKFGGSDNAHTDYENTTFYFDVQEMQFEKALDMFAQFFISPLMKEEAMTRERKAVHSEFQEALHDDTCRKQQIFAWMANHDHPMSLFTFGNETTLKLKISDAQLNQKLHQIRSRFYSAHYMTLAVQGRESLDALQDIVAKTFSAVKNNGEPKPTYDKYGFPFEPRSFHRIFKVVPVNDEHILDMNWTFPSLLNKYEYKPLHYIAYLIGHEGFGSLSSYFKKKVWAVNIYAGNEENGFEHNSTYALFNVRIQLTDAGFERLNDVVASVFQYVRMLQRTGAERHLFDEMQNIFQMNFDYAEEKFTQDNVQQLSEDMQIYASRHTLKGGQVLFKFDLQLIEDCLSKLVPATCNIMVSSKKFEQQNIQFQEEKWFKTKYCVEDILTDLVKQWETVPITPEFHLPSPNDFIPTNFEVYSQKQKYSDTQPPKYPLNILTDDRGELWFKQDFKFGLPRAYCYAYLYLDRMRESAEIGAMLDLFLNLFNQHIMEAFYPASMAQYETQINASDFGIIITVNGFNQKICKVVELLISLIDDFENCLTDESFNEMKQQQLKSYHNAILSPGTLRRDTRLLLLQEIHWQVIEKMKSLEGITKERFLQVFLHDVLDNRYVKMLVQGNIEEEESQKLYKSISTPRKAVTVKTPCPTMRTRKCPSGEWFCRLKSMNHASSNTSVINYYQGDKLSIMDELYNEFVIMVMDEPVFDTLRTKEQLGYSVYCVSRNTFGVLGISITVNAQADKFSVTHVNDRIETFLQTFSELLKNVSDQQISTMKDTLRNFKLTVDLTLKEEVQRNWDEIVSGECLFDRHLYQLAMIPSITLDDVRTYYNNLVSPTATATYRKLSVQVVGTEKPTLDSVPGYLETIDRPMTELLEYLPPTESERGSNRGLDRFITELRPLADSLPYFEPLTKVDVGTLPSIEGMDVEEL